MRKNYIAELKEALKNTTLNIAPEKFDPDKDLYEQGIDSFDYINILYALGDYFHVDISEGTDIEDLNTFNKIFNIIENKLSD